MKGNSRYFLEILLLIGTPTILAIIEIFHPAHLQGHVFDTLHQVTGQWLFIHYLQSFLFGLMALAVYYLTRTDQGVKPVLIRTIIFIFLITYTVMDAVAGIAIGRILEYQHTANLDFACAYQVSQLLFNDAIVGGLGSVYSIIGSWSWLVAMLLTVVQLTQKAWAINCKQCWPSLVLYTICAISLYISHATPYGPIAFGAFALASLWLLILKRGRQRREDGFII